MVDLSKWLDNAEDTVLGAEVAPDIPPGQYAVALQDARIDEFGDSDLPKIMWEHYITEGEQTGQVKPSFSALVADPEKMADAKTRKGQQFYLSRCKDDIVKMCDYANVPFPTDMRDMEETVAKIREAAPCYLIQVTKPNKGGFTNVVLLRAIQNGTQAPPKRVEEATPAPTVPAEVPAEAPVADDAPDAFVIKDRVAFVDDKGARRVGELAEIHGDKVVVYPDDDPEGQYTTKMADLQDENPKTPASAETPDTPADQTPTADAPAPYDEDADVTALEDLAGAKGVEVSENDTVEDMIEKVAAAKLKKADLTDEQAALCERMGVKLAAARRRATAPKAAAPKAAKKKRRSRK